MKLNHRIIITIGCMGLLLLQMRCGSDETPGKEEAQLKKLSHTWVLSEVKREGVLQEGYEDFELTLSGSASAEVFAYSTSGRPDQSPWPSGGTWIFGPTITSQLIRDPASDDELVIAYSLSGETLEIEFDFSGPGFANGRVNSVDGHWVFTFTR